MFIMGRIYGIKKLKGIDLYLISLILVIIFNVYNKYNDLIIIFVIVSFSIITIILEYVFNEWNKLNFNKFTYSLAQIKKPVYVMILFPCAEELIYRYFLYMDIETLFNNVYLFFILSVITFVFIHFFNQKTKCFYKIPFAILECIAFILFKNVFICIIIHMNFNILIYAYNMSKYNRGRIS